MDHEKSVELAERIYAASLFPVLPHIFNPIMWQHTLIKDPVQ